MWMLAIGSVLSIAALAALSFSAVAYRRFFFAALTILGALTMRHSLLVETRNTSEQDKAERRTCSALSLDVEHAYLTVVEIHPNGGHEADAILAALRELLTATKALCLEPAGTCDASIQRLAPTSKTLSHDSKALIQAFGTRSGCAL